MDTSFNITPVEKGIMRCKHTAAFSPEDAGGFSLQLSRQVAGRPDRDHGGRMCTAHPAISPDDAHHLDLRGESGSQDSQNLGKLLHARRSLFLRQGTNPELAS